MSLSTVYEGFANGDADPDTQASDVVPAIRFLTGVFLQIDILASADPRSSCFSYEHKDLLREGHGSVQLAQITGCRNWAMLLILEVLQLQRWKSTAKAQKSLSVRELAMRAKTIEDKLVEGIAELDRVTPNYLEDLKMMNQSSFPNIVDQITLIFACSAVTYLHVIVSGFGPSLVEIRESVTRTIAAIEALSERRLLVKLLWPVCVTGCLATSDQESLFRSLSNWISDDNSRRYSVALQIMEESWSVRDQEDENLLFRQDWTTIFKDQSISLLAV